jgi:phosphoenolpyruvate-protein kinase (PTS system EI component)
MRLNRKGLERRAEWSRRNPATLADGTPVHLAANVGGGEEARLAASLGARGVGLLRSEFLFMRYSDFPGVDQQAGDYRQACIAMAPERVIVRLLDCGADKPLPYARQAREDNPFLGERGIRYLMAREEQLRNQLRAVARVAAEGHAIAAMIPMVISLEEIERVREILQEEGAEVPVGIMVETPSSVLTIQTLAAHSDFVSIGTNDLVQYLLAVDRGNPRVAGLYREFHPAVMTAIDQVVRTSHERGIHVGVCGDMASHSVSALALLALGVDELSASVSAIPDIKAALGHVAPEQLVDLRAALLSGESDGRAAASALLTDGPLPWEVG